LHLCQDPETNAAKIDAISEYPLTYPALSFAIVDANIIRTKKFNRLTSSSNVDNVENEGSESVVTSIQLYCIQTR
jgi:hypothetical protein